MINYRINGMTVFWRHGLGILPTHKTRKIKNG